MCYRIFLRKLTTTADESQTEKECRDGRAESRRFYSRLELLHSSLVPFDHPPLTPLSSRSLRMSWEAPCAVSAVVVPG